MNSYPASDLITKSQYDAIDEIVRSHVSPDDQSRLWPGYYYVDFRPVDIETDDIPILGQAPDLFKTDECQLTKDVNGWPTTGIELSDIEYVDEFTMITRVGIQHNHNLESISIIRFDTDIYNQAGKLIKTPQQKAMEELVKKRKYNDVINFPKEESTKTENETALQAINMISGFINKVASGAIDLRRLPRI